MPGKAKTIVSGDLICMEDHFEYIDEYFKGELKPEEARQFEQKIADDKDFAEEVAFYLSAKQVLKEEVINEKKRWFREMADQKGLFTKGRQGGPVRMLWKYAAVAAVISCIFLAGYLLTLKPASPSQMAGKYIQENLQTLGVRMGDNKDSLQNALRLYNEGKLTSSLDQLERIIQADTSDFTAKKYAGIVSLRLENYDRALSYFNQLENRRGLYSNPAVFYKAITLMKRNQSGDKQQAELLLHQVVNKNLDGKEIAHEWLKKF